MHDLGEAHYFLGIDIIRDRAARTLKLCQRRLTTQLVETYGLGDCKIKSVPPSTSERLTKSEGEPLDKTAFTYTHLIGSLLYLSVCTRPGISQAVGALSKYMAEPTTAHWQVAKGLMRYVASTRDYRVWDRAQPCHWRLHAMLTMLVIWTRDGLPLATSSSCMEEPSYGWASVSPLWRLQRLKLSTSRQHRRPKKLCGCAPSAGRFGCGN